MYPKGTSTIPNERNETNERKTVTNIAFKLAFLGWQATTTTTTTKRSIETKHNNVSHKIICVRVYDLFRDLGMFSCVRNNRIPSKPQAGVVIMNCEIK
mmetsp:Transcript_3183/g.4700  ORF Transcript_3183/g.4700 Transcript_3183/m.4700 type:complete len:98 (+) Transcript_3183:394-687(+)